MTRRELFAAFAAALVAPHLPAISAPVLPAQPGLIPFIELPETPIYSVTVVRDRLFCHAGDGLYEIFNDVLDPSWMRCRLISKTWFHYPLREEELLHFSQQQRPNDWNL